MIKKAKMLIIDDSIETVAGLSYFFSQKYEVFTAMDGFAGLKLFKAKENGFDIIITDIVMPDISGVGVVAIIKRKCPNIPVIAITGWGEHPRTLACEAKADIVMNKPVEIPDLDRQVTDLLSRNVAIQPCAKDAI
jgi:DNA-binding response OmpR family regulator